MHPLSTAGPGPAFDAPDLAAQLSRPFSTGPGEYQLTATLRPPALGTVTALVRVAPTTIHVELSAANVAGHAALHSALHDLETALQQDRRSVQVQLSPNHEQAAPGGGGDPGGRRGGEGATADPGTPGAPAERDWGTSTTSASGAPAVIADGHIDLVL